MINCDYQSADIMPWKLIQLHNDIIKDGYIIPYYIQLKPTNKCNANCKWCSVSKRDKNLELDINEIKDILMYFKSLGTKAISISGGGEPTFHKDFARILEICYDLGIKVGLTTNGLILLEDKQLCELINKTVVWTRVSIINDGLIPSLVKVFNQLQNVDCSISYVVTPNYNENISQLIFDTIHRLQNITHIRFIIDIMNRSNMAYIETMNKLKNDTQPLLTKAIYQYRSNPTIGHKNCFISLLKPQILADGYIYPCCGIQYALDNACDLKEVFKMCHWRDFNSMTQHFNGSICKYCYYNNYNIVLAKLLSNYKHIDFL